MQKQIILDLRKKESFEKGHLPGAISFPIFSESEYAHLKKLDSDKKRDFYLAKFEFLESKLIELVGYQAFEFYCQKGELESRYFQNWFGADFPEAKIIKGGYKGYRKSVLSNFEKKHALTVLTGFTGSGKTKVLDILAQRGHSVLNFEECASHKGSVFGKLEVSEETSQEQFENNIHASLLKDQLIFTEMKGRYLGELYIPIHLFEQIIESPKVFLDTPKETRVSNLVHEYCGRDDDFLHKQLMLLKERIGKERVIELSALLEKKNYKGFIEGLLQYYDNSEVYRKAKSEANAVVSGLHPEKAASEIIRLNSL
ncbi:Selenophosphate-dependent tRNA 2-selenouridine synthase [Indibacter alkaliphilus LW1]|uniref:Selenophosphate-dependent tRNA 2-selenouridine synthase n=1 Tax=Indibacter alkaliphilus (strain CCUG 57479 / KCTC 22604 / LW1) TaxID=1189612 RepID=S2D3Y1_INDAL|nr:rhodanese-like domain-containing protein [Indibacter alkaliphilus]EOZ93594.1 Selenophosphate-dependent tRNA 2-selenouridine synthase [Indibacter alkaliphilus LW1]